MKKPIKQKDMSQIERRTYINFTEAPGHIFIPESNMKTLSKLSVLSFILII